MSLEHLWSGWRAEYVTSSGAIAGVGDPTTSDSVFTRILASDAPDDETFVVHRGELTFVLMNRFPYSTGHVLVLPYRQVADLERLTTDELTELWASVNDAVVAIKRAYAPEGINVGINLGKPAGGSVSEHLHVHVVPRWTGDSNFMTATANTRTLPEALDVTWDRLRRAWPGHAHGLDGS